MKNVSSWLFIQNIAKSSKYLYVFRFGMMKGCLKCSLPLPLPSQCPLTILFFIYKQPVYKQLGLELQKVKQLLGLKHVTIRNFANKIFAYENIATTLHNHISVYYTDVILFSDFIR